MASQGLSRHLPSGLLVLEEFMDPMEGRLLGAEAGRQWDGPEDGGQPQGSLSKANRYKLETGPERGHRGKYLRLRAMQSLKTIYSSN